jgi:hypothetical protein
MNPHHYFSLIASVWVCLASACQADHSKAMPNGLHNVSATSPDNAPASPTASTNTPPTAHHKQTTTATPAKSLPLSPLNTKEQTQSPATTGNKTTVAAHNTHSPTTNNYAWLNNYDPNQALAQRIDPPAGYQRMASTAGSFAQWLQYLPLKVGTPQVLLYNGQLKGNQTAHAAVVNIDVGNSDLQQCADAVMRLRAEYLWASKQYDAIHFKFTSGQNAAYSQWQQGYRPTIKGNSVTWNKTATPDNSYTNFKKYLLQIFNYCGTSSLSKELKTVSNIADIQIGDVFIKGGFPGHAVIVVDMAQNPQNGDKVFLLAQSYMPAQEIQLLHNPQQNKDNPWYSTHFGAQLKTPEWTFERNQLKRF